MKDQELWNKVMNIVNNANKEIQVYDGKIDIGIQELNTLDIDRDSILGVIILNTSGICIDNWVRLIGQHSLERKGIALYNKLSTKENDILEGMLIVGQDVAGGIFAIEQEKFIEEINKVWYFAPDTLEWECLDLNYFEFISWLIQDEISEFYSNMRWENWREDCRKINFDEMMLIYPFLWSRECDLEKASKKAVPYEELMGINFEYAAKFDE